MTTNPRMFLLAALALLIGWVSVSAQQPPLTYSVLIDADRNAATGCSITPTSGAPVSGFEQRLIATVDLDGLVVNALERSSCFGGSFSAPVPVVGAPTPFPVALNAGINGADAIELADNRDALDLQRGQSLRLAFVADNGSGSDVLATVDGTPVGAPIEFIDSSLPLPVPALSAGVLVLLALAVLALGLLGARRRNRAAMLGLVLLAAGSAWAMTILLDGDLADWSGLQPVAIDALDDATDGSETIDIVAAFATNDETRLAFRIDLVEMENRAPTASADSYSMLEDGALTVIAPGVLANDSDPDGDPLTAVLDAPPTSAASFALQADGSFSYQPAPDFNGQDAFSYFADDGALQSAAVTVTITVDPVNDAPSFTAGPSQTALQGAGAQTVSGWATDIDDGDGGGQALSFAVTTGNDALFSVLPSIDAASGNLDYTPSGTTTGTTTVTVVLNDDGGTANGGVNQSAPAQFDITVEPVVVAVDDVGILANGFTTLVDVLDNDIGIGLGAISFGDSVANAGVTPADGVTVLPFAVGGGTIDFSLNAAGRLEVNSNGTTGAGTVSVFYQVQSSNGSTDIGRVDVTYGDLPSAVDDTEATLGSGNEYSTDVGVTLNIGAGLGLLNNDTLGTPAAALTLWGGGNASASVDRFPGSSRPFAGGTLTVNADGSFDLVNPTVEGLFGFDYVVANSIGASQASVEIRVGGGPDLAITKTVDNPTPSEGQIIIYSIRVENVGTETVDDIGLLDDMNALVGVTYLFDNSASLLDSLGFPTSYNSGTGIWTVGTLDVGDALTLQITGSVNSGASGLAQPLVNEASLDASTPPEENPANDSDMAAIDVQAP